MLTLLITLPAVSLKFTKTPLVLICSRWNGCFSSTDDCINHHLPRLLAARHCHEWCRRPRPSGRKPKQEKSWQSRTKRLEVYNEAAMLDHILPLVLKEGRNILKIQRNLCQEELCSLILWMDLARTIMRWPRDGESYTKAAGWEGGAFLQWWLPSRIFWGRTRGWAVMMRENEGRRFRDDTMKSTARKRR